MIKTRIKNEIERGRQTLMTVANVKGKISVIDLYSEIKRKLLAS
jgi:hypothetical protein